MDLDEYYGLGLEAGRLRSDVGQLEFVRTCELLARYLPPPPAAVLDVGGGPGAYSQWLKGRGYQVDLTDPMPLHIEQARSLGIAATLGDARKLEQEDASFDIVLLLGPLYHLQDEQDRLQALQEALRVLRPGGWLFAVAISRFVSAVAGMFLNVLEDPMFAGMVEENLTTGTHRNPTANPLYFTTAFFHLPNQFAREIQTAGFRLQKVFSVEGHAWILPNLAEVWNKPQAREQLLEILRRIEEEPSLLGVTAHLLAVAQRDATANRAP